MNNMVDWIRQQIDEDERVAQAAATGSGRWVRTGPEGMAIETAEQDDWRMIVYDEGAPTASEAAHITRWDPAHVLAKVKADRLILDICEAGLRQRGAGALEGRVGTPSWDVVEAMAQTHAGRPGWRDEWAA